MSVTITATSPQRVIWTVSCSVAQ